MPCSFCDKPSYTLYKFKEKSYCGACNIALCPANCRKCGGKIPMSLSRTICESCRLIIANERKILATQLPELLEEFRQAEPLWRHIQILTTDEFARVYAYCSANLDSGEWFKTMAGFNTDVLNHPAMLTTCQAIDMLKLMHVYVDKDLHMPFVHSFGHSILDIDSVAEIGHFVRDRLQYYGWNTKEELFSAWNKFKWSHQVSLVHLTDCSICLDGIAAHDTMFICRACSNIAHACCKSRWLAEKHMCELCKTKYKGSKDFIIVNDRYLDVRFDYYASDESDESNESDESDESDESYNSYYTRVSE